jgi:hypothetical protein
VAHGGFIRLAIAGRPHENPIDLQVARRFEHAKESVFV